MMKKSKRKPNKLWVDQRKEFYKQYMYKTFKFKDRDALEKDENGEYKNYIYSVFNSGKNPVIERFNKTLKNKLWKQFAVQGNQKWLDILQKITSKYNNTIYRTINTTPSLASKDPSLVKIKEETYTNKEPKLKTNDRVRIFKHKSKFEKGHKGYWTKEIFKVIKINQTNPIMYTIQDLNNKEIQGSFYTENCKNRNSKIFQIKMPLITMDVQGTCAVSPVLTSHQAQFSLLSRIIFLVVVCMQ